MTLLFVEISSSHLQFQCLQIKHVAAQLIENATTYLFRDIIPVELTSFTANVSGNSVNLNWRTATELNNNGFEIQKKICK